MSLIGQSGVSSRYYPDSSLDHHIYPYIIRQHVGVVFRQSALGTIITLIGAGIGFVTTFFVVTRVLTPSELGLTRLLVEISTLMGSLALFATQSSAIRYYPYFRTDGQGAAQGFLKLLLIIPLVGFVLASIVYIVGEHWIVSYFGGAYGSMDRLLFGRAYYLVVPLMLFVMYRIVLEVYCALHQRISTPKLLGEVLLRLLLLSTYIAYAYYHLSFSTFLLLFVGSYGLCTVALGGYAVVVRPGALRDPIVLPDRSIRRDYLTYSSLTLLSALASTLVARIDIFMVSGQLGLAYGGVYTIAFYLISVVEMPSRSLMSMSVGKASRLMYSREYAAAGDFFRKVSHQQVLVGIVLFALIWANVDTLFGLIPDGDQYRSGKWVVFWLGLGKVVDLSFVFGNSLLRYSPYYTWSLYYSVIVMVVTIITNYLLISHVGITGAAIATLLTYMLSYAFQQYVLWSKVGISPIDRELVVMYATLALLLTAHALLPRLASPWLDVLVRSSLILLLLSLCLHRQPTFVHFTQNLIWMLHPRRQTK